MGVACASRFPYEVVIFRRRIFANKESAMKNHALKYILVSSLMMVASFAHAELKVAIVDMQKVVQNSPGGKKAKASLEEEFTKKKKELEKKETELKKMGEEIEKKKAVLSEDALKKKQAEFQDEMLKYRELVSRSQGEIQKRQADLAAPILEKVGKILDRLSKEKSYDIVLEKGAGILRFNPALNITDDVLKELEKEK
jgi:outer membrane protein